MYERFLSFLGEKLQYPTSTTTTSEAKQEGKQEEINNVKDSNLKELEEQLSRRMETLWVK